MNVPSELLPHEYECAYDPTLPVSAACANLISTVEALRAEFAENESDLSEKVLAAKEDFERRRADAPRVETGPRATRIQYMAPPVKQPRFAAAFQFLSRYQAAQRAMPGKMMLALVAAFDTFESQLMRAAFKIQPKCLMSSQQPLLWSDVEGLEDSDAIRALVVEREIESVLRQSHSEQLKALSKRFNMGQLDEIDEVPRLIEITERRNLYAHQGGRITAYYLSKCGLPEESGRTLGDNLSTDSTYFDDACDDIIVVAVKLTQTMWRAIGGNSQYGAADRDLAQIAYVCLVAERWDLARRLLKFACSLETHSSEQHKLVFTLNHAQAFKWQGNDKACESVLRGVDWDAKDQPLQLSKAVLLDDFEDAGRLMRDVGFTRQVQRSAFDHWPIYRVFRTTAIFKAVYWDLYGELPADYGECEALPA